MLSNTLTFRLPCSQFWDDKHAPSALMVSSTVVCKLEVLSWDGMLLLLPRIAPCAHSDPSKPSPILRAHACTYQRTFKNLPKVEGIVNFVA